MSGVFAGAKERHEVARYLARLLRELAPSLGLDVDKHGWISLGAILTPMKAQYPEVELEHIREIVDKDAQNRFEISGARIRARAGHRYEVLVPSPPVEPPESLYHGTSAEAAESILRSRIERSGKAYVHLATTVERARRIGLRKTAHPVILRIDTAKAIQSGIRFWRSGQVSPDGEIFLSDEIPADFVSRLDEP